jgi:D-lactate dehydrogenase
MIKLSPFIGLFMNIAFFSSQVFEVDYFQKYKQHNWTFFTESLNANRIDMIQGQEVVCVFVNDLLDAMCIEKLAQKKIKLIALRCTGFNNVDLKACQKYHIPVANVPHYSPHAVAEHAMALILTLNRKIHKAYNRIKEGNFNLNGLQGFDLYKKTVGIIGLGAIGQVFTKICHGFGSRIIGYDPYINALPHVEMVSLNDLCHQSDIISLHCPLNDKTRHIIDDARIGLMKPHVMLINTGRGALIDSKALIKALKQKKIGALGLDVYEQETGLFFQDHSLDIIQDDILMRLTTFPNVVITSHQGFLTHEALDVIAKVTVENINCIEQLKHCKNLIK